MLAGTSFPSAQLRELPSPTSFAQIGHNIVATGQAIRNAYDDTCIHAHWEVTKLVNAHPNIARAAAFTLAVAPLLPLAVAGIQSLAHNVMPTGGHHGGHFNLPLFNGSPDIPLQVPACPETITIKTTAWRAFWDATFSDITQRGWNLNAMPGSYNIVGDANGVNIEIVQSGDKLSIPQVVCDHFYKIEADKAVSGNVPVLDVAQVPSDQLRNAGGNNDLNVLKTVGTLFVGMILGGTGLVAGTRLWNRFHTAAQQSVQTAKKKK